MGSVYWQGSYGVKKDISCENQGQDKNLLIFTAMLRNIEYENCKCVLLILADTSIAHS